MSLRRILIGLAYGLALALFGEDVARAALSNESFLDRVFANDDPSWRLRWAEITCTDPGMTARERFFSSHCRTRGIQMMYLRPFFLARMKESVELKAYGHWGAVEHRTAAEGMKAYLLEKGLVRR